MVDHEERLRRLSTQQSPSGPDRAWRIRSGPDTLDLRALLVARLAALVAVGAPVTSYMEAVEAAMGAGASPAQVVDVLEALVDIVGMPRIVEAAPRLALALGCDLDAGL